MQSERERGNSVGEPFVPVTCSKIGIRLFTESESRQQEKRISESLPSTFFSLDLHKAGPVPHSFGASIIRDLEPNYYLIYSDFSVQTLHVSLTETNTKQPRAKNRRRNFFPE